MNTTFQIKVRQRGLVTLPRELREQNNIEESDVLTLTDLGNGIFVMSPQRSSVNEIADKLAKEWTASGVSLESLLDTLREVRGKNDTKP